MSAGIVILLLLIIAVVGGGAMMVFGGGTQALRHRRGGDLGPAAQRGEHPRHRLAEPTDEHAVDFGVSGENGRDPQPARVENPPPGTER